MNKNRNYHYDNNYLSSRSGINILRSRFIIVLPRLIETFGKLLTRKKNVRCIRYIQILWFIIVQSLVYFLTIRTLYKIVLFCTKCIYIEKYNSYFIREIYKCTYFPVSKYINKYMTVFQPLPLQVYCIYSQTTDFLSVQLIKSKYKCERIK